MSTVTTSVRMSKETKQRLKLLSAKIGKSQDFDKIKGNRRISLPKNY